jgi:hypothetical protein
MTLRPIAFRLAPLAIGLGLSLAGCSADSSKDDQGSKLAGEATFDPAPADQTSIESQLKRFKGQTQFLTPYGRYYRGAFGAAAPEAALAGGAPSNDARAVQESDVFKVGKPGSKLLFLLNNYRGLQVVSFADGADQPKVVGRVEATGNWPSDMYYDAAKDRLIVLENDYNSDETNSYDYSELQSRLVVYDVSDVAAPKIATTIDLKGTLSESRLVGDVLYVATSVRPSYFATGDDAKKSKGFVHAINLAAEGAPAIVQTQELSAAVAWGANMNVVEVRDGDAYKYYLIAVLTKDGWSWWDRQSLVEVVDISDAHGAIRPVMVVNAKGAVRERSQTSVKNGTLIVASNYTTDATADGTNQVQRVAVETFKFPVDASEILDQSEADFRKLHIDREIAKKTRELTAAGIAGDELADQVAAYRTTLLADAQLGLAGRFVRQAADNGQTAVVKPIADSLATVGNTQGLSANVQDVRFADDLLYVYWVPQNNIDPLDIFDLSAPENGVTHLSHLEFDGWIQRAIPVTYEGRHLVLGLGWIVPADSEQGRRYPQAVLFEIRRAASGRVSAEVLAQKNLGSSSTWANFNAQDKDIEVRFGDDGTGSIMYTFSSWDGSTYLNGGKVVGFDLKQPAIDADQVFVEGGVLAGDDTWLRRVFTNPEIDRINTFSDQSLGVYDATTAVGSAGSIVQAATTLELARNIQTYFDLTKGDVVRGVQVLNNYDWSVGGISTTELRLVKSTRADTEKGDALSILTVPGSYVAAITAADGDLVVLTQQYTRTPGVDGAADVWKTEYHAAKITLTNRSLNKLKLAAETGWEPSEAEGTPHLGWQQSLLKLGSGRILAAAGSSVKELTFADNLLGTRDFAFDGCGVEGSESAGLKLISGQLYLTYSQTVVDPANTRLTYLRNFISPVAEEAGRAVCQGAVNVPGNVLNVVAGSQVVTDDSRLTDVVTRGEGEGAYADQVTDNALASLKLVTDGTTTTAQLVDLYDPKNVDVDSMKLIDGNKLVFIESSARPFTWWGDFRPVDGMISPLFPRTQELKDHRLVTLGFDADLGFTKTAYTLNLAQSSSASLDAVFPSPNAAEGYFGLIGQGQKLQVIAFNGVDRPVVKKLRKVDPTFHKEPAADIVKLPGYYWYWSADGVTFTPSQRSLEIPQGYQGVTQVYID